MKYHWKAKKYFVWQVQEWKNYGILIVKIVGWKRKNYVIKSKYL